MLGVAVGKKGVGKTYRTLQMINQYVAGNPARNVKGRRVLIFDVNNEYEYVKSINLKDIPAFTRHPHIEARRVVPFDPKTGRKMSIDQLGDTLGIILNSFRGGLLLLEDINRYISDTMPGDIIGTICTNRHDDLDIIVHYQSIGRLPPKMWQNINYIRFHQITDSVEKSKMKVADKFEILSIAETIVNDACETNPRFYCFVNTEVEKIKGDFTPEMRDRAIEKYIVMNQGTALKSAKAMLQLENQNKKPSDMDAIKRTKDMLIKRYFDS